MTPSGLPRDTIETYTNGDCHLLACALQARLGGDLAVLWQDGKTPDVGTAIERSYIYHFLLRLPDGRFLDAVGLYDDEAEVRASELNPYPPDCVRIGTATAEDVAFLIRECDWIGDPQKDLESTVEALAALISAPAPAFC